eukprot:COSAG06_NODE_6210_length_3048_cov_5.321126_1_plen_122_part_00
MRARSGPAWPEYSARRVADQHLSTTEHPAADTTAAAAVPAAAVRSAAAKRRQAVHKKLRQIDELLARRDAGAALQPNQLAKIQLGAALRLELAELGTSDWQRVQFTAAPPKTVLIPSRRRR